LKIKQKQINYTKTPIASFLLKNYFNYLNLFKNNTYEIIYNTNFFLYSPLIMLFTYKINLYLFLDKANFINTKKGKTYEIPFKIINKLRSDKKKQNILKKDI
jgi:hypothetical protein